MAEKAGKSISVYFTNEQIEQLEEARDLANKKLINDGIAHHYKKTKWISSLALMQLQLQMKILSPSGEDD